MISKHTVDWCIVTKPVSDVCETLPSVKIVAVALSNDLYVVAGHYHDVWFLCDYQVNKINILLRLYWCGICVWPIIAKHNHLELSPIRRSRFEMVHITGGAIRCHLIVVFGPRDKASQYYSVVPNNGAVTYSYVEVRFLQPIVYCGVHEYICSPED